MSRLSTKKLLYEQGRTEDVEKVGSETMGKIVITVTRPESTLARMAEFSQS